MNDPYEAVNLVEVLQQRACQTPEKIALRFIAEDGDQPLSYRELDERARALAVQMRQHAASGARAVLLLPSGPDYVTAFFACLYANIIAVPAYPPESVRPQHLMRLRAILDDAEPSLVLTDSTLIEALRPACERSNGESPLLLAVDQVPSALAEQWQLPTLRDDDIAFLQYTSGSTSTPKGVQVTQGNLLANERLIRHGLSISDDDVMVSWLPLFHDMGLIGGLLQPIYSGFPCVLMSPRYFLERPQRWLEAISKYRGTISGGPDFAYRLCCERLKESAFKSLDLSCWRLAYSGSEPIRPDTLERFASQFAVAGFDENAWFASYGLAEATLFVSGSRRGQGIAQIEVDTRALADNLGRLGSGSRLVSCGWGQPEHPLMLVDPVSTEPVAEGGVGEVWSSGPSVASGYWRNPQATAKSFIERDGRVWLRTGDLGFMHGGELFITGRLKDMIIIRGQNLYPQDLERCVEEEVDVVRKGRVSAFAIEHDGNEGIGIAAEIGRSVRKLVPAEALIKAISEAVAERFQEVPVLIALLEPGALPKTSSGKLQRSACRQGLADGSVASYAVQRAGQMLDYSKQDNTPLSAAEQAMAELWAQVLDAPVTQREANFFALGGNSIKAAQLMARLRELEGRAVELRLLFEAPQLDAFVAALDSQPQHSVVPVALLDRQGPLLPSAAQQRLWFLWKLEPHSAVYNIGGRLRLRGQLNLAVLQEAFTALLQRHEVLRSRFVESENGEVTLQFAAPGAVPLSEVNLGSLADAELEIEARADAERFIAEPFDLANGPLLRLRLQQLDTDRQQLLLCVHHIVADGWSLNLLLGEFTELYSARLQGREATIAPLSRQYLDVAEAQRQQLQAGEGERQLQWWKERLGTRHVPLELPFALPYQPQQSRRAAFIDDELGADLSARLGQLALRHGVTPAMLLLAAFNLLLQRYSATHDLRVGLTQAGRESLDSEALIGFFVNLLVLRCELPAGLTLADLLHQVRENVLQAQAHQSLPFEQLVEALHPERGHGRHPLCQVAFDYQWQTRAADNLSGLQVEALEQIDLQTPFDLVLRVRESQDGLRLNFCYASEGYAAAGMQRLASNFRRLLQTLLQQPADQPLQASAWLPESEWRDTADWPVQVFTPLSERIAEQCLALGDRPALIDPQHQLSFTQLETRSNALANHLIAQGIGAEVRVGVALPRGVEIPLALLAVMKAGGAYVPLDIDYPRERLTWLIQDAGIHWVLTHSSLRDRLSLPDGVLSLELDRLDLSRESTQRPVVTVEAQNLAYLIYTSGSTGQPKGVAVAHGEIAMHCQAIGQRYAMSAADRELIFMSFAFDGAHERWLTALSHGASVLIRGDELWTAEQTLNQLREHSVSVAAFPPAYLLQLAEEAARQGPVPSMRIYCFGGDAVPEASFELARRHLKAEHLINGYGPTETVVTPLLWKADASTKCGAAYAPIGEVVGARRLYVLDDQLQPLPRGVAGELYIGGEGLARGYHQRPAMTAERFIADPFSAAGGRLYRTGDRVRLREDNAMDYLGRVDQQVKIRGFRIEPGEIEARLQALPGVHAAAVCARESVQGLQLVGYVVAVSGQPLSTDSLKTALRDQVPDYMVPAHILLLDSLPLNINGKLDRNALPEPQGQGAEFVAPLDGIECQVAAIWSEVLGVARVGRQDDFFDLGGHSLLATQVVSRIKRDLGLECPLRTLFECSRLNEFAARLAAQDVSVSTHSVLRALPRNGTMPLSAAQSRLWFFWQMEPQSAAYNVPGALRLRGALDLAALRRAFDALVQRHETLRTRFDEIDGHPFQVIEPAQALPLVEHDLSGVVDAELQARQLAATEAMQPFDLRQGPLLRLSLIRLGDDHHVLLLTMHHMVSDGWSIRVLVNEFSELYGAFTAQREPVLAPLSVQYADYAQWQRELLASAEGARQLAWWKERLGTDQIVLELATDRPRPAVQSYRGASLGFELDGELGTRLKALAKAHDVTLFMLLLAAYGVLLRGYSGQRDLRIAVPVASRQQMETEGLIGFFVNTQVMPCHIDDSASFAALLAETRQLALGAQANQDLPFEQLVEALQPERSLAHNPLVQVKFNFGFDVSVLPNAGDLRLELFSEEQYGARFDLALDMAEGQDNVLRGSFVYASDLFDATSVAAIAQTFRQLLVRLCEAPTRPLSELPLAALGEADELRGELQQWPFSDVLAGFAAQVVTRPEAIAVQAWDGQLSYAQLDAASNRLAHRLQAAGVQPGDRVALCQARSSQWVLMLLSVMKAGAAYVPLDPALPLARLQRLVVESDARCVLLGDPARLTSFGDAALLVDAGSENGFSDAALSLPVDVTNAAYVIFTSGSTGQPKGVVVSHGALANYVQGIHARLDLQPGQGMAMVSSVAADLGNTTLFGALCSGGRLCLASQDDVADAECFAAFMQQHAVDVLKIVPGHLSGLLAALPEARLLPRQLLVVGGEACDRSLLQQVRELAPACRIVNHYGPSEATVGVLTHELAHDAELPLGALAIGRPLPNCHVRVVDEYRNPLPVGVPGELLIGGAGLADGYLSQPELSAEYFVHIDGERLYRSGDRVRLRHDGLIEFLGRLDEQVKIRGYRVELGEITQALKALPGVSAALVLAEREAEGPLRLLAWCVSSAGNAESLRQALAEQVPEYMLPAQLMLLPGIPLTPNGKVDRQALPRGPVVEAGSTQETAMSELESQLADIWQAVLKIEAVCAEDNFFELGGDSILSLQIISRIRKLGYKLSPKQLFERQSVRQLAQWLESRGPAKPVATAAAAAVAVSGELPLAPVQARFFERVHSDQRNHWNQAILLQPKSPLDLDNLTRALHWLLGQHDSLRLRFDSHTQPVRQVYAEPGLLDLTLLWRRRASDEQTLERLCDQAQRSLDLNAGPLLRAMHVSLEDGSERLLLVIHHLAVDGVSWRVLLEDLESAYRQLLAGKAPAQLVKSDSYQAWTQRQHAFANSAELHAELGYWQAQLQDAPALPQTRSDARTTWREAAQASFSLDSEATRQLLGPAQQAYRTQINDLLLTALARALCSWSGAEQALIELEGHGRDAFDQHAALDLSRSVGWFTSLYPVRLSPQGDAAASLKAIKEQLRGVPRAGIGYGLLRYLSPLGAQLQELPPARVTFNYLGQFDQQFTDSAFLPAKESVGRSHADDAQLGNWLVFNGKVLGGCLQLELHYSREMFDAALIDQLLSVLQAELQGLLQHCLQAAPALTPSDVPLAGLDQAMLDSLPVDASNLEDLYPLAPMQQGMLFHALDVPGSALYVNQLRVDLDNLDEARFVAAWQQVLSRHATLRSGFLTEGLEVPLQFVLRHAELPVEHFDWRERSTDRAALDALADSQRQRGFDLTRPPLQRLALVRLGERRFHLLWTCHHLLLDGWSSARLIGEVLAAYQGSSLPPVAGRYRDYIAWLQVQDASLGERFWRQRLAGFDEPTLLATACAGSYVVEPTREVRSQFDAVASQRLQQFAQQQRVTLNTLLQGAWLLLLQRYSGRSRVAFGATVAGRPGNLPGAEDMLGLFINTLPIVQQPQAAQSLGDWLRELQAYNLEVREFEHSPLYDIQRWAGRGGQALFDSILVFENFPMDAALTHSTAGEDGLRILGHQPVDSTNYALTLVASAGECLDVRYGYRSERFCASQVERLREHFECLLLSFCGSAEQAVAHLPMLAATEREQLLHGWNDTAADFPDQVQLQSLIEQQVAATPDALAVQFGNQQLSYRELNARANQLARWLREQGVGPDVLVGVCVERSLELVLALLAIVKAGGAYVPTDPDYPRERLEHMLGDSGVQLLLTQQHLLEQLPASAAQTFCLDSQWPELQALDTGDLPTLGSPQNLAYLIYTSGSTGKPKGAGNSHAALINRLHWMQKAYQLDHTDRILQKTPFSFDVSVWEFFWPLLTGAALVVAEPGAHRDPLELRRVINEGQVSVLHFVPSMLQAFVISGELENCPSLKQVMCSGEALPYELQQQFRQRHSAQLHNLYGPTEAAIDVSYWACDEENDRHQVPIGRPIDNLRLYILDAFLEPVPQGVAGELYIGGVGLARGYHLRPGLTAERFVADPFTSGERLYRTGDLARWRADGAIEYVGRIDHQVKIRGLRIELGEIEARLQGLESVEEAVVIARDTPQGKQLVGYVVVHGTEGSDSESLRRELLEHLPEYMVPAQILVLPAMPLSPNGKLDRKALPAPEFASGPRGYVAPGTELEQQLVDIWQSVLGIEKVGITDDFFELGGHSLLLTQVGMTLRKRLNVELPLHRLFELSSIQALAAHLQAQPDAAQNKQVDLDLMDELLGELENF
ncbi:non-ribosomal peptide synthase/polyketide synthase [Pseudomonas sp. CDFA 553]|nr:non-ribosomal peptide synthase/polyketide synthase [Pseudomonas quasicaspiana]MCD5987223.1 non-ribosomal peptide synthase/polyketide synthase [Pseudomonas quasicaspiana]